MRAIFRKAEHLLLHPDELLATITKALGKAYAKRALLFRVFEDFLLLFRLVLAWARGEYEEVPRRTVFWAIVAIIYFLSPIDLIPDIFPGGYLDDIAVITFVIRRIRGDLDKFTDWEKKRARA